MLGWFGSSHPVSGGVSWAPPIPSAPERDPWKCRRRRTSDAFPPFPSGQQCRVRVNQGTKAHESLPKFTHHPSEAKVAIKNRCQRMFHPSSFTHPLILFHTAIPRISPPCRPVPPLPSPGKAASWPSPPSGWPGMTRWRRRTATGFVGPKGGLIGFFRTLGPRRVLKDIWASCVGSCVLELSRRSPLHHSSLQVPT